MLKILENTRHTEGRSSKKHKLWNLLFMGVTGFGWGVFAKWLDLMATFPDYNAIEDQIIMQFKLDRVFSDLGIWAVIAMFIAIRSRSPRMAAGRVLIFFLFVNAGYLWYTKSFCGFDPTNYILGWVGISFATPILAYITWYAKGHTLLSYILKTLIITCMTLFCFTFAADYFSYKDLVNTVIFGASILMLYENRKQCLITLVCGIGLAFIITLMV